MTSAGGGGGRAPKSRRKEQNQLICDSDKGGGRQKIRTFLRTSYTWKPPKGKVVANVQLRRRHASASFSGIWRSYYMNNMSIVIEMREREREREQSYRLSDNHRHRVMCACACGGRTIGMGKERPREIESVPTHSTGSLNKLFTGTYIGCYPAVLCSPRTTEYVGKIFTEPVESLIELLCTVQVTSSRARVTRARATDIWKRPRVSIAMFCR